MGVVSCIAKTCQIGANWSEWSFRTRPALGPLTGYGALRLLPGGGVPGGDALRTGTFRSGFRIVRANSRVQTPSGFVAVLAARIMTEPGRQP